ncbi:MAG: VWA domain-containing protein [Phycisphaerales bacterium]|nr:MAG: VWA domain-containing protein [Phycisphaerales bacterium]
MRRVTARWCIGLCVAFAALLLALIGCESGSHYFSSSPVGPMRQSQAAGTSEQQRELAPAGSLPALDEEVWVIVKAEEGAGTLEPSESEDVPGCGAMLCAPPAGENAESQRVPLPLKHTDVKAAIEAYIASVEVTQQFENPFSEKIEAVYVFPLPQNAAISGFVMIIGDRKIRGILRDREEAEKIYYEARSQGYRASLLTQERPNIFTQQVANIEPGKRIDVNITYFHTLSYVDGWYEFVFPMVVGPRFNPPGMTDGVGAVARGESGLSGQSTEVQYLKPGERSGHDIALAVDIAPGVPVEEIACRSHDVQVEGLQTDQVKVALSSDDAIPNKDFVLRYRIGGSLVKTAMLTHLDGDDGYFTFMLYPPQDMSELRRAPIEMVFVIDCSGSMSGEPIAIAKRAMKRAIGHLQPGDAFQIIRFSNDATTFRPRPTEATKENIRTGIRFVDGLKAGGGTMMNNAVKAALAAPPDAERVRYVTFMTDGYIGNEAEILGTVHNSLNGARLFSFGIGSSPNRYLLNRMAKIGNGAVAYVGLRDDPLEIIDLFVERISHPALTGIEIDWGKLEVSEMYPQRVPDLYVGRPVVISGRFRGSQPTTVTVSGRAAGHVVRSSFQVDPGREQTAHDALSKVWARMHIAELMDRATWDSSIDLPQQIRLVALNHGLMSSYTAFVAVDSSERTAGNHGTTVQVAVPVPDGVKYETTVSPPSAAGTSCPDDDDGPA